MTTEVRADRWWPRAYQPSWLRFDLVAGLTAAAVVIPQAMAYAAIAGLPVEVGLYSASVPMVAYALAGTSRPLSVSVTSSIAAVTATAIAGTPDPRAAAAALAVFSGLFLVLGYLFRLGFVAELISAPVLTGFKVGVGVSIAIGQLHALLGVDKEGSHLVTQLWDAVMALPRASVATMALAAACIAVLLGLKRLVPAVPGPLVVVVLTIAATALLHLDDHGIALVGQVPSGFPTPQLPAIGKNLDLVLPGLGVALIAFVESIAAARAFQAKDDPPVQATREMGALGLANVVSSLLRGMPAGGGMSQTAIADGAGAKSPLTGIVGAATVVVTLLFLAPVFSDLPEAALGALVFVAAIGLVDLGKVGRILRTNRRDGLLTIGAALGVASMGALDGIVVAVLISVLTLLYETSRRPVETITAVPRRAPQTGPVPEGLLVLRPGSDIYFANVQRVRRDIDAIVAAAPVRPRVVLFDVPDVSMFEYTAHEGLRQMVDDLLAQGIEVWEVEPRPDAREAALRYRRHHGGGPPPRSFPDLPAAVATYRAEHPRAVDPPVTQGEEG